MGYPSLWDWGAKKDYLIEPWHVSLYLVLLDICKDGKQPGLFAINKDEVMAKAKTAARQPTIS